MPTHKLLLLPGDGIGVETMAEVERLVAFIDKSGLGCLRDRGGSRRRRRLRRARRGHHGCGHGQGAKQPTP